MDLNKISNPYLVAALIQKHEQRDTTFTDEKLFSENRDYYVEQSKRTTNGQLFPFRWARHILSA